MQSESWKLGPRLLLLPYGLVIFLLQTNKIKFIQYSIYPLKPGLEYEPYKEMHLEINRFIILHW